MSRSRCNIMLVLVPTPTSDFNPPSPKRENDLLNRSEIGTWTTVQNQDVIGNPGNEANAAGGVPPGNGAPGGQGAAGNGVPSWSEKMERRLFYDKHNVIDYIS